MIDDEAMWKRRLLLLTAVRLSGILIIALGIAVALTSYFVPGGNRFAGALIIVVGTLVSAFGPEILKRAWRDRS